MRRRYEIINKIKKPVGGKLPRGVERPDSVSPQTLAGGYNPKATSHHRHQPSPGTRLGDKMSGGSSARRFKPPNTLIERRPQGEL